MVLNRVVALKDSLAVETGRLVSLFLLSKHLGEKFHEKITDFIDKYTIATLRYYTTYEVGREFIYGINNELNLMELKNINQKTIADSFLYILGEIEPVREKIESLTKGRLLKAIKLTNYTLAFLLISILFLNRGDIFADTLFIVLSTTVVFILLILEDYENLKIGDYIVNISNSEQLFDLIGRKRYYPRSLLRKVRLERGKTYRIGFYNSKNHSEETVTLEYSHEFDLRVQRLFSRFLKKQKNI
jgi:predicted nucleic acid-binding protein